MEKREEYFSRKENQEEVEANSAALVAQYDARPNGIRKDTYALGNGQNLCGMVLINLRLLGLMVLF